MDRAFFFSVANFSVFFGILFFYLRNPVKGFLASRHLTLKEEVSRVREQLRVAQEKYEELSAKLKVVDVEISNIRDLSQKDAASMQAKLMGSAKQTAGSILSESKARAVSLAAECKEGLRSELGLKIIARTQKLIQERMTRDDRARIRKEFSQRVGSVS